MIHINQVGYSPKDPKIAIVANVSAEKFQVRNENLEVVYEGAVTAPKFDPESGDTVAYADFSALKVAGTYEVVAGDAVSPRFGIGEGILKEASHSVLKMLYFLRCGTELLEEHAGAYAHKCCHRAPVHVHGNMDKTFEANGGWHDAGDYGKYPGPGAVAVAHLLLAYQQVPTAFGEKLNIPESHNPLPDVLNEAKWELDFLIKCVDLESGGVYHKITSPHFPGMIMPEEDDLPLVASPISATATAATSAIFAMGASVFEEFDKEFSEKLKEMAHLTYGWLVANKEYPGFKNPADISTGEYGDDNADDERFWAAAQLYQLEQDPELFKDVAFYFERVRGSKAFELGWRDVAGFGMLALIFGDENPLQREAGQLLEKEAQLLHDRLLGKGYFNSLETYQWGSNGMVMNHSMLLVLAGMQFENPAWLASAKKMVDYILGANPLGISYLTGFGSVQVMNPHHRPSDADGIAVPVPGMIPGGPNARRQDEPSKEFLSETLPPARAFIDHWNSYATNEVTIYWNSPAVLPFYFFK